MYLVVGLGNPGEKYKKTRHNVGWLALDEIISCYNLQSEKDKFVSQVYKGIIASEKIIAVKPLVFMNDSGKAISKFVSFYKIPAERVIVIYDDLDMKIGKIRLKRESGSGGHNGIKSINSFIKNDYIKIKIGIDRPRNEKDVSSYVLENFADSEIKIIKQANKTIAKLFEYVIFGDLDKFRANVNM
ncbi:MAG: aminoacyl-tRNA hydrolase [Rickettsiales bacterium]|nr:aminoacyl-tRNA hydrolase [Rickettsiales bacterium]